MIDVGPPTSSRNLVSTIGGKGRKRVLLEDDSAPHECFRTTTCRLQPHPPRASRSFVSIVNRGLLAVDPVKRESIAQPRTGLPRVQFVHPICRRATATSHFTAGERTMHPSMCPWSLREYTGRSNPSESASLAGNHRPDHRFGSIHVGHGSVRPHIAKPRQHLCRFAVQPGDDYRLVDHNLAD